MFVLSWKENRIPL